jgi:hypothetical protein
MYILEKTRCTVNIGSRIPNLNSCRLHREHIVKTLFNSVAGPEHFGMVPEPIFYLDNTVKSSFFVGVVFSCCLKSYL